MKLQFYHQRQISLSCVFSSSQKGISLLVSRRLFTGLPAFLQVLLRLRCCLSPIRSLHPYSGDGPSACHPGLGENLEVTLHNTVIFRWGLRFREVTWRPCVTASFAQHRPGFPPSTWHLKLRIGIKASSDSCTSYKHTSVYSRQTVMSPVWS